ncbi:MAG: hypothetical protein EPO68_12170 [Planctomycetota bacterium]|nr:MAG: hypothetical protein EPO68_12170 [Planctomycetota bacterium]
MKIAPLLLVVAVIAGGAVAYFAPGCSKSSPPVPPASPALKADEAALVLQRGLGQRDLAKVWDGLPPAWQQDVTALVQDFASRMDPAVWNRTAATARKATGVLKDKRAFVLDGPAIGLALDLLDDKRAPAAYDALVAGFDALANSELADLEKLKQFDGRAFAAGAGARVLASAAELSGLSEDSSLHTWLERGSTARAKLLADGDARAIVELTRDGEEKVEQVWVKVDGRWVPQQLADEWPNLIAQGRELVDALAAPEAPKLKGALIQALPVVDGFLDRLADAKTQGEFDSAVRGGALTLAGTFSGMLLDAGVQFFSDE